MIASLQSVDKYYAMAKDPQMIGRRGEKRFEMLCSDANVTCNRSTEDDYGWDKLIEFQARTIPFLAIDMQPEHVMAAVQVKTTETASRSISLSLSNALRYAKSSVPHFIVMVALDGTEPKYFARHVWGTLLADWLKAGRQADADGLVATNKRKLTMTFGPEDERGEALLAWIRGEIEAVQAPYAATKKAIVDTIGFEDGYGVGKVTFVLEGEDDMLDFQLGLRPYLEASRFVFTSERFGIRASKPEIDEANVRIHLTPEGRACTLTLEFPTGERVIVPATLYSTNSGSRFAYRIASLVLDTTFGPGGRVRAHAHLLQDDRATLNELRAFAHLHAAMPGVGIMMQIGVDGKSLALGSIRMNGVAQSDTWGWIALSLDVMRAIAIEAGDIVADPTIGEVNDAIGQLHVLSALAGDRAVRVDFVPEPDAPDAFDGFLSYASATVGDQVFGGVAYRPIGLDQFNDGRRQIVFGPARLLWSRVARKADWDEHAICTAYQRQLDRLGASGEVMAIGNLQHMIDKGLGDQPLTSDLPTGSHRDTARKDGTGAIDELGIRPTV